MDGRELNWFKSSRSNGSQANCVEVARIGAKRAVRDSTNPEGGMHVLTAESWDGFVAAVKDGRLTTR